MDKEQIREIFKEVVARKSAIKINGMTKNKLYEYRHRAEPNIGIMIEVLLEAGEISIIRNEFKADKE